VKFICEWQRRSDADERANVSELCRIYGVSRETGHKWIKRFVDAGRDFRALDERSRRPATNPRAASLVVQDLVVEARKRRPKWGPVLLRRWLGPVRIQSLRISALTSFTSSPADPATSFTPACSAHALESDGRDEGAGEVRARVGTPLQGDARRTCRHVRALPNVRHSRPTGDLWIARYRAAGHNVRALEELSRRPHTNPRAVAEHVEDFIVDARKERPRWGARKLRAWLSDRYPGRVLPSTSCIAAILERRGLTVPRRRRRRVVPLTQPFAACDRPNAVWCVDFC
jgi:hypothetical protein